ncbi:MAG: formyltetrahydrofolate deformylase [Bdellovibrionota bacterium]|jgi:formyltetrahydrofolate deformylase
MKSAICLISCHDQKGIVAKVTNFIFSNNGNILHLDQHIDPQSETLFMRVEWLLDDPAVSLKTLSESFQSIANFFNMDYTIHLSEEKERVAIFVSTVSHCLYDILLKVKSGELNCEVPLIISNHTTCREIADYFNIPFYYFEKNNGNFLKIEEEEVALIKKYEIDTLLLARYMRILSPQFVEKFPNRIINVHHSFLPAFVGKAPYEQAFARGVKIIGATSHYVTAKLDSGPIIEQATVRINHSDTVKDLQRKGKELERLVLSKALQLHLAKKILVYNNKTVVFD